MPSVCIREVCNVPLGSGPSVLQLRSQPAGLLRPQSRPITPLPSRRRRPPDWPWPSLEERASPSRPAPPQAPCWGKAVVKGLRDSHLQWEVSFSSWGLPAPRGAAKKSPTCGAETFHLTWRRAPSSGISSSWRSERVRLSSRKGPRARPSARPRPLTTAPCPR